MNEQESSLIALDIAKRPITVGEMVVADYRKADVFRKFGIDYCCGGKKPLDEICRQKKLNLAEIQTELDALDQTQAPVDHDYQQWPPDTLANYIEEHHHQYVAASIPVLDELTAKVARVHGERHPELLDIARHYREVAQELAMHMLKEERILFPFIRKMQEAKRNGTPAPIPVFGSIANPIHLMEAEHESAGGSMEAIRTLSSNYTPPQDACTSYRVLFAKLQEFEQDLHQHVHLENNILFPKAIAIENA
jgi:regulator of cell morphogenesis and NO signaling